MLPFTNAVVIGDAGYHYTALPRLKKSRRVRHTTPMAPLLSHTIQFRFVGVDEEAGAIPAFTDPVNLKKIEQVAHEIIASAPTILETPKRNQCSEQMLSQACANPDVSSGADCTKHRVTAAQAGLVNLVKARKLVEFARHPERAAGLGTLGGLAQESSIVSIS